MRRANRSQVLACVEELMMSVIYGPKSPESFATLGPDGSWVKTSADCSLFQMEESSVPFSQTWPTWGIALDGRVSELTKPRELPSEEIGSSSSDTWRTPYTGEGGTSNLLRQGRKTRDSGAAITMRLADQVDNWPTPVANDDNKSFEAHMAMKARMKGGTRTVPTSLKVVSENWPTPRANSAMAATVNADAQFPNLETVVANWATPRAGKVSGPAGDGFTRALPEQAEHHFHLDQAKPTDGEPSSPSDPTSPQPSPPKRRLNYRFVLWLMGFPEGWL